LSAAGIIFGGVYCPCANEVLREARGLRRFSVVCQEDHSQKRHDAAAVTVSSVVIPDSASSIIYNIVLKDGGSLTMDPAGGSPGIGKNVKLDVYGQDADTVSGARGCVDSGQLRDSRMSRRIRGMADKRLFPALSFFAYFRGISGKNGLTRTNFLNKMHKLCNESVQFVVL
jgi:hypothetical protein